MMFLEDLLLLPSNTVLFPDGALSLRIFDSRYIGMVRNCLKNNQSFGIYLNSGQQEARGIPVTCFVGTEAQIQSCDESEPGVLKLTIYGKRRFRSHDYSARNDGVLNAKVVWLEESDHSVPESQNDLIPLLQAMLKDPRHPVIGPYRFDSAAWVGARYAESLDIPVVAKQRLLELEDVVSRLEIIQQFLRQRGILSLA